MPDSSRALLSLRDTRYYFASMNHKRYLFRQSMSPRNHLAKRDLWGLNELWMTCEAEAKKTSGHT